MEWLRILGIDWDRLGKCTSIETLAEMSNAIARCCLTFKLLISMYQSLFISGR